DKKIRFIVSGSNASLLSKELSTLLTGRNITFQVRTLSFPEFLDFNSQGSIDEFLTFGGFPEVVLEKDETRKKILLQQYFEDIINKDIISRHRIRNINLVFSLCRFLIENSGGKTSLNRLGRTFGISDDSVSTYISYMIDSYLIIKVPFFSYSLKKKHSVTTQPKYYASDNGLIYITSLRFSGDTGKKYENAALLKIYEETDDISYWSEGKSEVDFVYDKKAVNVTSSEKIPEREFKGLNDFSKKHKGFSTMLVARKTDDSNNAVSLKEFLES
ncbi:AAA family ATPase, partial [Candidatus Woesearchaeota archaeon]|nr:AAA family ATPase [Candidatus Woesearchaeota archaeon]